MREKTNSYRLQLSREFTFDDARTLLPHLASFGIDVLYLSPIYAARKGSMHGYDVVDPSRVCEERGGEAAFCALCEEAHALGFSILVDFVPNHMALTAANPWIKDIFVNGQKSQFANHFDIDYDAGKGKLIVPFHVGTYEYVTLGESINYRRFFDITHLIGLRMEDPAVFTAYHASILQFIRDGYVDGLRIDHIDGMRDPKEYLDRLRSEGVQWLLIEKILTGTEQVKEGWEVDGTVGYEHTTAVNQLFVNKNAEDVFTTLGDMDRPEKELRKAKKEYVLTYLKSEMLRLGSLKLIDALADFPRYRTYVVDGACDKEDTALLERVGIDPKASFVPFFQQVSAAAQAKGFEDTHLYQYNRLLALNEVGGDPHTFGYTSDRFHALNIENLRRFPDGLLPSNTHDTKRSENVRCRILALTEYPTEWVKIVTEVMELWHDSPVDSSTKYFLLQTLIGMYPRDLDRLAAYMQKVIREAKVHTSWKKHNLEYEREVEALCFEALESCELIEILHEFEQKIHQSATQKEKGMRVLRAGSPGIVDTYFGAERTFNALVDPDNRRAVSFREKKVDPHVKEVLLFRKEHHKLLKQGAYIPLQSDGIAFARVFDKKMALFAAGGSYVTLPEELKQYKLREVFENNHIQDYPRLQINRSGSIFISI